MKAKKEYDSNYDMVSTEYEKERFQRQKEENNKMENYNDFDNYYLKYIDKIKVEKIKIGIEFIFFICQLVESKVKKPLYIQTNKDYKIIINDKKFNILGEIEIEQNSKVDYIGEIKEKEDYEFIISMDGNLYKLSKTFNQLEFIYAMSINEIIQINKYEYIISNKNGTFKYEGSIIDKNKEKLEIKEKKITDEKCNFGVLINERIIALAYNDRLVLYFNNSKEPVKIYKYENLCESCYALFKSRFLMLFGNNKIENNILLFGCKKDKENGFSIFDIENLENSKPIFIGTGNFEVNSFLQINKNKKAIVEAFSLEYNKKYTYFLVCGYDDNENKNKIKLYRFYLWKKEMEFIKDIGIKNTDLFTINNINTSFIYGNKESRIQSIIQNKSKNLLISNNKGETMKLDIMNLEKEEEEEREREIEENGNILFYEEYGEFIYQNYGYYLYELKDVDISKLKNIEIEYMHQLENGYLIIVQKNNISVAFVEDNCISLCKNFKNQKSINCICEIKKFEVIISQNDGLYKLVLPNDGKNIDSIRLDKINDNKLNIFSNKNDYIVSCELGTFRVFRDIPSITYKDLNEQNKLSNNKYDIVEIIEINNHKLAILISKKILEIIDLDNSQNRYKREERNNHYVLSRNCIVSFKTKKDSNNHIFMCALKKGILVLDITQKLNKTIPKIYRLTKNLEITCMCPFKQNIQEEKFCSHFLIGGINDNYEVEIDLYKVINSDEQYYNNNSPIKFIKTVVCENIRMNCIIAMYQSVIDGELMFASDRSLIKLDLEEEEIVEDR